jgi:hypothetical protein
MSELKIDLVRTVQAELDIDRDIDSIGKNER